ncbi:c-type cytochrome [Sphingopyxis terrae]|uniref:c-type cytochrome n=1 Tax=Sphingopyxis terrae TaxID=33052 RepID=UPI0036212288
MRQRPKPRLRLRPPSRRPRRWANRFSKRCAACHTIDKDGPNGIGPNLHGIVGRPVASHPGFAYSGAMKAKGGVWDAAALDIYLADPMKIVPGTRMAFAGVIDAADRQALILYLEDQSK